MENIHQALASVCTPIFFGIEHLPLLHSLWPQDRPLVILEKCKAYHTKYLAYKNCLGPIPNHWQVITGELGLLSPLQTNANRASFQAEIHSMVLPLLSNLSLANGPVNFYKLPEIPYDELYSGHLISCVYAALDAIRFY